MSPPSLLDTYNSIWPVGSRSDSHWPASSRKFLQSLQGAAWYQFHCWYASLRPHGNTWRQVVGLAKLLAYPVLCSGHTSVISKSRTRAVSSRMAPSSSCHEDSHELPTCATKAEAELCQPLEHHKVLTFCALNQLVSFRFTSPYLSTGR